ncbi:MAG: metallophosphoesterase family protein [Pontixanthobacter sp.]
MFQPLKKMFSAKDASRRAAMPDGQRAYVIGDIHGRNDLLIKLVAAIEADDAALRQIALEPVDTSVILLGDLIDRGPDSAGVIATARALDERMTLRCLMGNHEEMFLDAFEDTGVLRHFLKHGGRETILSYGISRKDFNACDLKELQALIHERVPADHLDYLRGFEDMITLGDYLFVHAGIDPLKPLDEQSTRELRWIRESFLSHKERHSHIVVHGHTITEDVDERKNRIGIDTGAYRHGRLTALVLEGDTRRYIQAVEGKAGGIDIFTKGGK